MIKEYELTKPELTKLLDACKPTPCMMIGSYVPATPQENANRAWQNLASKYGFKWDTVKPIPGKEQGCFTAEADNES